MAKSVSELDVDDVDVTEVWARLQSEPDAVLIDVRSKAEWTFVGLSDLSAIGKQPVLVEWKNFSDGEVNPAFTEELSSKLASIGATTETNLYFMCRSGSRSLDAGKAMAAVGYRACHNVADGFEGPVDGQGHRGTVAGWKAVGLPWVQR